MENFIFLRSDSNDISFLKKQFQAVSFQQEIWRKYITKINFLGAPRLEGFIYSEFFLGIHDLTWNLYRTVSEFFFQFIIRENW